MQIGIVQIAQRYGYQDMSDAQVYDEEIRCAQLADELGYDLIAMVEHHFEDYALCPDNFVYLAHLAALTKRIKLMTGAVIVPWNLQPLRVAEKAALLDLLSGGRFVLGFGRGLARREYAQFGIPMEESRGRFDEAVPMILEALETGVMPAHTGQYFHQPRASIRPRPTTTFKGRTMQVAMSGDSILEAARHGFKMLQFSYKDPLTHRDEVNTYAQAFRARHAAPPPIPFFIDFMVCDEVADRAAENAEKYVRTYLMSLISHYEMMGDHFPQGYEEYGQNAKALAEAGLDNMAAAYLAGQTWGTPQQILDKISARRATIGDYDGMYVVRFAGAPYAVAERSLRTFATRVMPELKSWNVPAVMAA